MSTIKTIDINVSGLNPNNKYRFVFNNKGGNWPVRVTPRSGIFYPPNAKTYVYFCANTGECNPSDSNVFNNTPSTEIYNPGLSVGNKSLYSVIELSISEYDNTNDIIYTHPCIVECDECAPPISIRTDSVQLTKSDGSSTVLSSEINGLMPNQSYTYLFSSAGGNWPVKVVPVSGIIKATAEYANISNLVALCSSETTCAEEDATVLNYANIDDGVSRDDPYSVINLTVTPVEDSLQSPGIGSFSIICDDCISKAKATLPGALDFNAGNIYNTFDVTLENLIVGQEYQYSFQSIQANWPVVVQPYSGTIIAREPNETISAKMTFCPATGLCPSGSAGILDYNTGLINDIGFGLLNKSARVRLNLIQTSNNNSIYSNELSVFCDDCTAKPKIEIPDYVSLASGKDSYEFNGFVTNLIPDQKYSYKYESIEANWPATIYPISGTLLGKSFNSAIPTKLAFCRTTGICPSSDPDILDYDVDSTCATGAGVLSKNIKLRMVVNPISYYENSSFYSNELLAICQDCLPQLKASLPSNYTLTSENSATIASSLSNLIPGTEYYYEFKGVDANWPAILYPLSGVIIANSTTENIVSKLTFCPSTGICPNGSDNVLTYSLDPACSTSFGALDRYAKIKLEVKDKNCGNNTVSSNESRISCLDCLKTLKITQPLEAVLDTFGDNTYILNTQLDNLIPGEIYRYSFSRVDSNWPTIVSRQSGEFKAVTSSKIVKTDIGFCYPSGSCASDTRDTFLTYKENSLYEQSKNKFLTVGFSVQQQSCSNSISYSDDFTLYCKNCLPISDYAVAFSGAPVLTLPVGCCSGTKLLAVNIINAIPGDSHSYQFISGSPGVTLTPSSGNIVFQSNGSATILTVADIALETQNQAVIQFKLTNTSNHLEAMDYLAVRCGPECI